MAMIILDKIEIKKFIPHLEPFLLLDEVLIDSRNHRSATGTFNLETRPILFTSHCSEAYLSNIYLLEAMSQLAIVTIMYNHPHLISKPLFFHKMQGLSFYRMILPEDKIVSLRAGLYYDQIPPTVFMLNVFSSIGNLKASQATLYGKSIMIPD